MKITVYYVDGAANAQALQPVEIRVPKSPGLARTVLDQLLDPPVDLKLLSGIPAGTKAVHGGLNLKDGILVVDLSQELYKGTGGSAWANGVAHTLVWSMTEIRGVESVLLRVEGQPATLEGIVWDRPLNREVLGQQGYFRIAPGIPFKG